MKRFLTFLILFPLVAFAQTNPAGYTISGKLAGIADGTEIRLIRNGENEEIAKATFVKGSFLLKGSVTEPVLCFLVIGDGSPVELYVENSKITISNDKEHAGKYLIKGSVSHGDFINFIDNFLPLFQQLNSLANTINSMKEGPDREGLMNTYNGTKQSIQTAIDRYVKDKPNSMVTPFVLNVTSQFYDDPLLLEKRFKKLSPSVKSSETGKELEQLIAVQKIGAVGTQALDFIQPDTLGQPLSLSSFHGKYVLVDFWASWCGPCRNENPNVVENFNRFKDKNFTVLGVSLDKPGQKEKWMEAIHHDSLSWSHVSDLQFWNNAAAKLYRISQIPQNLLIDPTGKIVGRNLRGLALQTKLCELLGGCN